MKTWTCGRRANGRPSRTGCASGAYLSGMTGPTRDRLLVAMYFGLYGATLLVLRIFEHFDPSEALTLMVVLGGVLPALAWWVTRHSRCLRLTVHRPGREAALLAVYLVVLAFVIVFGFDTMHRIQSEPLHSLALLAVKLATFVGFPVLLLVASGGYSTRELFPFSLRGRDLRPALWMSLAILALQAVAGRGFRDLQAARLPTSTLLLAAPLSFAWLLLEAGLVEEFFFRALVQERAASVLGSRWVAWWRARCSSGWCTRPASTCARRARWNCWESIPRC